MKVVMNLRRDLIIKMRALIKKGQYKDMTSLINDAIVRLIETKYESGEKIYDLDSLTDLEIDDDLGTNEIIEGSDDSGPILTNNGSFDVNFGPDVDLIRFLSNPNFVFQNRNYFLGKAKFENVHPIYVQDNLESLSLLNENKILWGQANRYFPLKVALRGIYFMENERFDEEGYISTSSFEKRGNLFKYLAGLGMAVNSYDVQAKRRKGDKISTGLPYGQEAYKIEKSTIRFMAHYLFEIRKDNLIDGALAKLKFIKVIRVDGEGYKVAVTRSGYDFTKLHNPFLDGLDQTDGVMDYSNSELTSTGSLSAEEKDFLINHIKDHYLAEFDGMKILLNNISDGNNTPTAVKASMESFLGRGLSPSSLGTMVNGLVSRCTELSLINKTKLGLNVTYNVTSKGKSLTNQQIEE